MSNCEDKEYNEMKGINEDSPFKNFIFSNDVYYTPIAPDSRRVLAVKNYNGGGGFRYEVVGVFDINELPRYVQELIPILQAKVEKSRYKKKLSRLQKRINQLSKES